MKVSFRTIKEEYLGQKWRTIFNELWPHYQKWFFSEGNLARPSYLNSLQAIQKFMPELLPIYEEIVELSGGSNDVARFLSLYKPPCFIKGCSQAIWLKDEPVLIRNYDYNPTLWDGLLLYTSWHRPVIAVSDCLWGVLDGINDAGLALSLSFGGRKVVGDGFGIPLILRYILEFCDTTADALNAINRIPSHMAYNITVVDASSNYSTAFVAPDHSPIFTKHQVTTNHQQIIDWQKFISATKSVERCQFLLNHLDNPAETLPDFISRFLNQPILNKEFLRGWWTLYNASYFPKLRQASYRWQNQSIVQSFKDFKETTLSISIT